MELLRGGLDQRAAQEHLRQETAQPHHRVDGCGHQRCRHGVDLGHHHHTQVLGFLLDVGLAFHQHGGVHALHLQVVGGGHALVDQHVAAHKIEREAFAEHIPEIEREAARQGLQAEHAQQLGQARVGLQKLPRFDVDADLPGHGAKVGAERRADPAHLPFHAPFAPAHHIDHAKPRQQVARVADVELEVQRRAPLGAARLGHAPGTAQQGPVARGGQAGFRRGDVELAQAPLPLGPFGAAVLGFDLDATELAAAQFEVVHHHVHRGQRARLLGQQVFHLRGFTLRHAQARQARKQAAIAHVARCGLAKLHVAVEFRGVQVGTPQVAFAQPTGHQVVQGAALGRQLGGAQGHHVGQVVHGRGRSRAGAHHGGGAGACTASSPTRSTAGCAGGLAQQTLPRIHIHPAQPDVGGHALGHHRRRFTGRQAHAHRAAQHPGLGACQIAQVGGRADAAQVQRHLVAQRRRRGPGGNGHQGFARHHLFIAQGLLGVGRLAQGRGQVQRHALQGGVDLQLGHPPAERQRQAVGRAAGGVLRQLRHKPQRRGLLQPLGCGHALRAQLDGGLRRRRPGRQGAHAAFQPHIAAQRAGLHTAQGEAGVRELHHAAHTAQGGRVGGDAHLVARQRHAALHLGFVNFADRQAQPQLQIGIARAAGLGQGVARHARQGRGGHEAQHFRQRPPRLGVHPHHGAIQVGNLRLHLGQARLRQAHEGACRPLHLHGRALKDQLARQLRERRPAQRFVRLQAGRHVGIGHVLHLRGDAEVAPLGVVEGHVVQVAPDLEIHMAGHPRHHRLLDIAARLGRNAQRQVAVHPRAIGPGERTRQIQHARKARAVRHAGRVAGVPRHAGLALGIGIGKVDVAGLHRNALALQLPAHIGAEFVQRQHGVFKHAGQHQGTGLDGQGGLAAGLVQVKFRVGVAQAQRTVRLFRGGPGQREALHLPPHLVLLQGIERPFPGGLDFLHHALGRIGGNGIVGCGRQGQAAGNLGQRGQVQLVGTELALRRRLARSLGVLQLEVATRPVQAIVGHKLQPLGRKFKAPLQAAPPQAAFDGGQLQRLQPRAQGGVHVGQRQVGRAAHDLAALHIGPGPQGTTAARHVNAHIGMVAQARDIHPREMGKQLPVPVLPIAVTHPQQRRAEHAHQREAVAPGLGGRGVHTQTVAPVAVAQHHIHLLQRQLGGAAHLVVPAHGALADHHLAL